MTVEFPAVPLWRYAERIGYRCEAFNGIDRDTNVPYACREIWTKYQRDDVEFALLQAQAQVEATLGYPLVPHWITAERHRAAALVQAQWGYVIAGGVMKDTMIGNSVAPDYTADPATVTVAGVTCALADVHLFFEDSDQEITPMAKALVAGVLTLTVPWCRLVDPAYQDNPVEGWDYADVATWSAPHVDVRCITNDTTTQATVTREACQNCATETGDACILVRNPKLGLLKVQPESCACIGSWQWADLNYYAGMTSVPRLAEDAIIRLAHANMPAEPCSCAVVLRLWQRDRYIPEVITRERVNCPFGSSSGAWTSWVFANSQRLIRGSMWA